MSYKRFLLALMLVSSFVLTSCGSIPYQTSRTPQIKKSTSVKTSNKTQVTSDSMGAVVLKQAQTIEEKDIQLEPTDSDLSTLLSKQTGKYYLDDGPPEQTPYDLLSIPDAEVKIEPLNRFKNRPYVALGKTYQPLDAEKNYRAQGMGSWYGKRFHGKKTASGELYDMFKMTAAHPTLPIPSYARVTNLTNGTQIVVRINDRGPFHSNRIIDLSYAAATKLGYAQKGSTELLVERIMPDEIAQLAKSRNTGAPTNEPTLASNEKTTPIDPQLMAMFSQPTTEKITQATNTAATEEYLLQFGAYRDYDNANRMREELQQKLAHQTDIGEIKLMSANGLFKLYSGPYSRSAADLLLARIKDMGMQVLGFPKP